MVQRCEYRLADLMIPYLLDAAAAGVDFYSDSPGRDLLSLDSFDEGPVSSEKKKPDHFSPEHPAVDQPPGELCSPPIAKKRKLMLPEGSGNGWE